MPAPPDGYLRGSARARACPGRSRRLERIVLGVAKALLIILPLAAAGSVAMVDSDHSGTGPDEMRGTEDTRWA